MKGLKEFLKKYSRQITFCICMIMIFLIALKIFNNIQDDKKQQSMTVSYNEFKQFVENGDVDVVYYSTSEEWMSFCLFNEETKDMPLEERNEYKYNDKEKYYVLYPAHEDFRKELMEQDVRVSLVDSGITFTAILSSIISLALPIAWVVILFKLMSGGVKGVDKSQLVQTSDVTFDNVIGQDEILDDIQFITKLIKDPKIGDSVGAKVPKGILLSGEPGTGKTLIAKAIAGEAGVPFLYVNASSMIEMFVGLGAKRVRDVFKIAREQAPCIIFIDEIDSIGCKRDSRSGNSEHEQTINALLQEMDGFSGREGVFIIAATNRPDKLDSALTRAGRFDRQIVVNKPRDWKVRKQLFEYYLNKYKLDESVDIEGLSKQCSGFTGADIATICNEASLIAVMNDKKYITRSCIEEAIDKKIFHGNRSKSEQYKEDKIRVAYHESGHAVMTYLCKEPISRASIIGTTSGVGGAVFGADKDSYFETNKSLRNRVMIAYAGRASEDLKFNGDISTGASNDISQATNVLLYYVERYGFDKDFGLIDMSILSAEHIVDGKEITSKLSSLSKDIYSECINKLQSNYNLVERLAEKLLEVETLSGKEIEELLRE